MLNLADFSIHNIVNPLPDHSPSMWGWHKDDPNMVGDDLVSLQSYQSYIDDPTLIKDLMVQQGVTDVESVEITGQMSGGTSTNNYKGYIHWTDGTETKVLVKGRRKGEAVTASYREALFYSRLADGVMDYAKVPQHYLAVADISNGDALFIEEFATGYSSLQDIYIAYLNGTLEDLGIDPSTFDFTENQKAVMSLTASWSYSHWMDESLFTEWWMKNYDEVSGHGRYDDMCQKTWVEILWFRVKRAFKKPDAQVHMAQNTIDCVQAVIDAWSLSAIEEQWQDPNFVWGLTHGDYHPGQLLASTSNLTDIIIADFEFAGVMGSPAIDLATWLSVLPNNYLEQHEEELVIAYYQGLITAGLDPQTYPFEQLWEDYTIKGFAQLAARYMYIGGWTPSNTQVQPIYTILDNFVTRHDLKPERMMAPSYGGLDMEC